MQFQSDAPEMGNGPYATPLMVGDRLFTAGVAGRLQCLDKKRGSCCGRSSCGPIITARR